MENKNAVLGLLIGLGLAIAGFFIGRGFIKSKTVDRYVTVKGISERDVIANKGFWAIRFAVTDNELNSAQAKINRDRSIILNFLRTNNISEEFTELQNLSVQDKVANAYNNNFNQNRYVISQTIMVRSENPSLLEKVSQKVGDLVDQGVVLAGDNYGSGSRPSYLFNGLNQLKPEMIAEATENARSSAEKFAADSGSKIGGIRKANQGVFQILARDRAPGVYEQNQVNKTVRVVSTIEYYLK
jgi:hypothetical protein